MGVVGVVRGLRRPETSITRHGAQRCSGEHGTYEHDVAYLLHTLLQHDPVICPLSMVEPFGQRSLIGGCQAPVLDPALQIWLAVTTP